MDLLKRSSSATRRRPFLLISRLRTAMAAAAAKRTYIVNVSAMEGVFDRGYKGAGHRHADIAKAALNMLTRTSAQEMFDNDRILMTAVDTGWITDERPHPDKIRLADAGFHAPLDLIDGAARVYSPSCAAKRAGPVRRLPEGLRARQVVTRAPDGRRRGSHSTAPSRELRAAGSSSTVRQSSRTPRRSRRRGPPRPPCAGRGGRPRPGGHAGPAGPAPPPPARRAARAPRPRTGGPASRARPATAAGRPAGPDPPPEAPCRRDVAGAAVRRCATHGRTRRPGPRREPGRPGRPGRRTARSINSSTLRSSMRRSSWKTAVCRTAAHHDELAGRPTGLELRRDHAVFSKARTPCSPIE
ncbi:hypothetical protein SHIRM173S_12518 [Streptomyces hirsutus]